MRTFFIAVFSLFSLISLKAQQFLPDWQPGMLDIHHISTGRGNAAFIIFPDSTTLLIDAGEISDTHPRTLSPRNSALRPDTSRSAAEWIVDYVRQFHPSKQTPRLDYVWITHFHDDHFGEWDETRPTSRFGNYVLTGITTVGEHLPIGLLLDRGAHYPINLRDEPFQKQNENDDYHIVQTLLNYWRFIDFQKPRGLRHDSIRVGASDQLQLRYRPGAYPNFKVRNVVSGGRIWTGYGEKDAFARYKRDEYPGENPLSSGLKISFGAFDYFSGGDLSGIDEMGGADWNSMEALIAPVVGPVDVATLNHHGNRDSQSPYYVRTLRPQVWVQQGWSSDHPGEEVLRRLTSEKLYPGPRDLFTTDMLQANIQVIGEKIERSYRNLHGHVLIRVTEGGASFRVYVLNDFSRTREIIATYGPYRSR